MPDTLEQRVQEFAEGEIATGRGTFTGQPMARGAVPGQVAATPPFFPESTDEQTKKILGMLLRSAAQRKLAVQPRPTSVPGRTDPFGAPPYMTEGRNPHAWGAQRLMYGIQQMIGNAVSRHKEQQITKAVADWEYAQAALNEYYAAEAGQDQAGLERAQKKLDVIFGDPKKLKAMAKALNQDWLNPEKTTVHGEALKRVAAERQQGDEARQQARGGISNLFRHLIGRGRPGVQYTPEEQRGIEREVIERAPTTAGAGADVKTMKDVATVYKDLRTNPDKYDVKPVKQKDGSEILMAYDKTDPTKPAIEIHTKAGEVLHPGGRKAADQVLAEAQAAHDAGDMATYREKLKEVQELSTAGRAGAVNQFTLLQKANAGDKDAAAVLQEYWKQQKMLAEARGQAFGMGRAMWQINAYVDADTGQIIPMSNYDAIQALKQGRTLTPSGKLPANMITQAQRLVSEATPAIDGAEKYLKTFDSAKDRAIFARILSANPAAVHGQETAWLGNILDQALTADLSDDGKHYVQQMRRLSDSLGLLRATIGLPATETMTALTLQLVPGPATPDSKFAAEQIDLLKQMVGNAVAIPALKGVTPKAKGGRVINLD